MELRDRIGRPLWLGASWVVIGFVLTVLLAAAAPLVVGDRSYIVRSGSMSPAIDTGDVVVVEPISPLAAEIGDIVTFEDPEGRLLTHRARAIDRKGDQVAFITQGDANTARERWRVAADGKIGRVVYRVPKLGFLASWISTPAGKIGLIIVPALLLAISLLRRIWRSPEGERGADELAA